MLLYICSTLYFRWRYIKHARDLGAAGARVIVPEKALAALGSDVIERPLPVPSPVPSPVMQPAPLPMSLPAPLPLPPRVPQLVPQTAIGLTLG